MEDAAAGIACFVPVGIVAVGVFAAIWHGDKPGRDAKKRHRDHRKKKRKARKRRTAK